MLKEQDTLFAVLSIQVRKRDFEEAPLPSKNDLNFSLKDMNILLGLEKLMR